MSDTALSVVALDEAPSGPVPGDGSRQTTAPPARTRNAPVKLSIPLSGQAFHAHLLRAYMPPAKRFFLCSKRLVWLRKNSMSQYGSVQ